MQPSIRTVALDRNAISWYIYKINYGFFNTYNYMVLEGFTLANSGV
jgi:hypothetical protein